MKRKTVATARGNAKYPDAKPFDVADYLVSEAQVTAYLDAALEEADPAFFKEALGTVARARGMGRIAEQSSTTRAGLYKALSPDGNPEFGTVQRVMNALGYRLQAVPIGRVGANAKKSAGARKPAAKRRAR